MSVAPQHLTHECAETQNRIMDLFASLEDSETKKNNDELSALKESMDNLMGSYFEQHSGLQTEMHSLLEDLKRGMFSQEQLENMVKADHQKSIFVLKMASALKAQLEMLFENFGSVIVETVETMEQGKPLPKEKLTGMFNDMSLVLESVDTITRAANAPHTKVDKLIVQAEQELHPHVEMAMHRARKESYDGKTGRNGSFMPKLEKLFNIDDISQYLDSSRSTARSTTTTRSDGIEDSNPKSPRKGYRNENRVNTKSHNNTNFNNNNLKHKSLTVNYEEKDFSNYHNFGSNAIRAPVSDSSTQTENTNIPELQSNAHGRHPMAVSAAGHVSHGHRNESSMSTNASPSPLVFNNITPAAGQASPTSLSVQASTAVTSKSAAAVAMTSSRIQSGLVTDIDDSRTASAITQLSTAAAITQENAGDIKAHAKHRGATNIDNSSTRNPSTSTGSHTTKIVQRGNKEAKEIDEHLLEELRERERLLDLREKQLNQRMEDMDNEVSKRVKSKLKALKESWKDRQSAKKSEMSPGAREVYSPLNDDNNELLNISMFSVDAQSSPVPEYQYEAMTTTLTTNSSFMQDDPEVDTMSQSYALFESSAMVVEGHTIRAETKMQLDLKHPQSPNAKLPATAKTGGMFTPMTPQFDSTASAKSLAKSPAKPPDLLVILAPRPLKEQSTETRDFDEYLRSVTLPIVPIESTASASTAPSEGPVAETAAKPEKSTSSSIDEIEKLVDKLPKELPIISEQHGFVTRSYRPQPQTSFEERLVAAKNPLLLMYEQYKDYLPDIFRTSLLRVCTGQDTLKSVDLVNECFVHLLPPIQKMNAVAQQVILFLKTCEKLITELILMQNTPNMSQELFVKALEMFFKKMGEAEVLKLWVDVQLGEFRNIFDKAKVLSLHALPNLLKQSKVFNDTYHTFISCQSRTVEAQDVFKVLKDQCRKHNLDQLKSILSSGSNNVQVETITQGITYRAEDVELLKDYIDELLDDLQVAKAENEELNQEVFRAMLEGDKTPGALLFFSTLHDPFTVQAIQQVILQLNNLRGFAESTAHVDFPTLRKRIQVCLTCVPTMDKFMKVFEAMNQRWIDSRISYFSKRKLTGGHADAAHVCPLCTNDMRLANVQTTSQASSANNSPVKSKDLKTKIKDKDRNRLEKIMAERVQVEALAIESPNQRKRILDQQAPISLPLINNSNNNINNASDAERNRLSTPQNIIQDLQVTNRMTASAGSSAPQRLSR